MQENQRIIKLLRRLWHHLSRRRRWHFVLLLILMTLASFAEVLSIGALVPFLAVLTDPKNIFEHSATQPLIEVLGLTTPDQLLLPLTFGFCVAALISGSMRLLLIWANTRLSFATGADLGISIYRKTLYQPYVVHVSRNSSEVINGIVTKAGGVIYSTIGPVLTLISSSIMLISILMVLLTIDPTITIVAFSGFGLVYGVLIWLTRSKKIKNSHLIAKESTQIIKSLQEGLGGIRDVLIDGSQPAYCHIYSSSDRRLRNAQGSNQFLSQAPRYGVEAIGMMLIGILAYMLTQQSDGIAKAIPVLGVLALGAQRMLPVMQQSYAAWSSMQGGQISLSDTLDLLDQPLPDYAHQPAVKPLPFQSHIRLNNISFRYSPNSPWTFRNLDISISKGSRVGLIGKTGSGKSTLIDIVMGLLYPGEGTFEIDGQVITAGNHRAWQSHIAHVPQAIFLADSSIEENIALGQSINQIDRERVRRAAQQAQMADIIEIWPQGYQTFVGERGIRLSGGQRQRIGIARALYKQADVIIFDEATSALDDETEQAVMRAIEGLSTDITMLIIAHRLSTLKNCTQIVELGENGKVRVGSYQEIVGQAN